LRCDIQAFEERMLAWDKIKCDADDDQDFVSVFIEDNVVLFASRPFLSSQVDSILYLCKESPFFTSVSPCGARYFRKTQRAETLILTTFVSCNRIGI
jgi:hypothetical protein